MFLNFCLGETDKCSVYRVSENIYLRNLFLVFVFFLKHHSLSLLLIVYACSSLICPYNLINASICLNVWVLA